MYTFWGTRFLEFSLSFKQKKDYKKICKNSEGKNLGGQHAVFLLRAVKPSK